MTEAIESIQNELVSLVLHGANMKNVTGQQKMFAVRMQPEIEDQLDKIREAGPKGWYGDDNAALKRCIVLTGLVVVAALLETDPKLKLSGKAKDQIRGVRLAARNMNIVARSARRQNLQKQADKETTELIKSDHPGKNGLVAQLATSNRILQELLDDEN